jgi:hypothetical protein
MSTIFQSNLIISGDETQPVFYCYPPYCDDQSFRIYFLPCSIFLSLTSIPRHESILSQLVCHTAAELDQNNVGKRTFFISHRWVNGKPDTEENIQFEYIKRTIQLFSDYEHMFVWIDYSCMKQDSPDLPTIRRLNYILSYCDFFMIVLPENDPYGVEYISRVWCLYEWLSVIHFRKTLIIPNEEISSHLLSHTLEVFSHIIFPSVFQFLETIRLQCHSRLDRISDCLNFYVSDSLLDESEFVSRLQAYDPKDKEYVYQNISSYFKVDDILFLHLIGQGVYTLQIIPSQDLHIGSLFCGAVRDYIEDNQVRGRSSTLSSLDLTFSSDED